MKGNNLLFEYFLKMVDIQTRLLCQIILYVDPPIYGNW